MKNIYDILLEFNESNSTIYKIETLKKYKDNPVFVRVLQMTLDTVKYNYFIRKIPEAKYPHETRLIYSLEAALDFLDKLNERVYTGNNAIDRLANVLGSLREQDKHVIERILDRDLKIGVGKTATNSVIKGCISKPVYQRCAVYTEDHIDTKTKKPKKGTSNKIVYPAKLDLKCDGTYRQAYVDESTVEFLSRSGEEYFYPLLSEELLKLSQGFYFGELTVILDDSLLEKIIPSIENDDPTIAEKILEDYRNGNKVLPRSIGNGLLNSDDVPHENIRMDIWEYVTETEYYNAERKIANTSKYIDRFRVLEHEINSNAFNHVAVCEYAIVNSKQEAMRKVSEWMSFGLEGGVLKNLSMVFRDGTNPEQLKMKLKISAELRCVGFSEGKKGTKREKTFGGMKFENDDKTIRGQTSGFSDKLLQEINSNRDFYIGQIIEVEFNDITKAKGNDYYALSHPRFIQIRDDKTETDSLAKVEELKEMAMLMENQ